MSDNVVPVRDTRSSLPEIALLFLKLGTTAFGGPAAHIAMMDEEVVRRRHWLTEQEFLDYLSAVNFIPGPNSVAAVGVNELLVLVIGGVLGLARRWSDLRQRRALLAAPVFRQAQA